MIVADTDHALWAADVLLSCLQEAEGDMEVALAASEYILRSPGSLTDNNPFPVADDAYPRDGSGRFVSKHRIAAAACDPTVLAELWDAIPEDQRYKLDRAVQHLQSGGSIHHPKEPSGLAIDLSGRIVDLDWAYYERWVADRDAWKERQGCRDECRRTLDEMTRTVRASKADADTVDGQLTQLAATEAELRRVSRARHEVTSERRPAHHLEEIYEDVIEAIHHRLDRAYDHDPEPPAPEEPGDRPFPQSPSLAIEGGAEPVELESDRLDRVGLIAEILVSLHGDQSVEVAKKLRADADRERMSAAMSISAAFHLDVNGIWHGPQPPGPGWYQIAPGPAGGMRWAPGPGARAPGQSGGGTSPSPQAPPAPSPAPAAPARQSAAAHRTRFQNATAAYDAAMKVLLAGGSLSAPVKTELSKHLSVMNKGQLNSLYTALGGTALITGAQRQPWVHAIKGILLGPSAQVARKPAQQAAQVPATKNQSGTGTQQVALSQAEQHWETGKPQPGTLNGVDFAPAPPKFWERVADVDVGEPPPLKKIDRVGVLIQEPDGRVWIVKPTDIRPGVPFGDRHYTIPGGHVEPGLSDQQNALKEVWEETGLQVEITGHAGDFEDSNNGNNGRLYIGKRVGGAPWDAKIENHIIDPNTGKPAAESEKVSLVPPEAAAKMLNRTDDLAQIMAVQPIPLDHPVRGRGSEPLKKFLKGIEPAKKAYEDKKTKAGQSTGNGYLHVVQNMRGFNAKPKVVKKAEMDNLVKQGTHIEVLRGLKPHGNTSAEELADDFRKGEHYPGFGIYGSGTYSDSKKGHANQSYCYASAYSGKGAMLRMAIPKTAKIVKASELKSAVPTNPELFKGYYAGKVPDQCWRGVQAALSGYDVIHVDRTSGGSVDEGYYVILNRGIITVQEEDATGHLIR